MRIPSHFNEETLYGRRAKRPSSSQAYRRLFRLAVALVLVVVVMSQAAQPRVWRVFFGDPQAEAVEADARLIEVVDLGGEDLGSGNSGSGNSGSENSRSGNSSSANSRLGNAAAKSIAVAKIDPEIMNAARAVTRQQNVNDQRQWTVVLDRWQSGESFPLMRSVVPGVIKQLDENVDLSEDDKEQWQSMLERFDTRYGNGGIVVAAPPSSERNADLTDRDSESKDNVVKNDEDLNNEDLVDNGLASGDAQRLTAWLAALDEAAVGRVIDGSVWRSQDFDAFYRQLDQAHTLRAKGAVAVSVVPLMQQPKVYLGNRVRVRGVVASVEQKKASANPFGVTKYWELWIKPEGGGDRPMVLILPDVPRSIQELAGTGAIYKGPEVNVVGRFFKRLAYPSGIGADAAPVVLGRVLGFAGKQLGGREAANSLPGNSAPGNSAPENSSPENNAAIATPRKELINRLWMTVAAALLFGLTMSAAVMWRTSVMAKQSREVRAKRKTAVEFPDALVQHTPKETEIES